MMTFSNVPYSGNRLNASLTLGQQIADTWGIHPLMIQMSRDITGQWRANSRMEESRAIQAWIKRRVRYVPDPHGAEMMADPLTTIKNGGDCDDQAILASALLQAIGHDARVGAVTWEGKTDPSHAVAVDLTAGCIVDPVGNEPQNWPPPGFKVKAIKYRDKAGQLQSMNGLFSKLIKAVAKPFQQIFPAKTLLGKVMDPLGLTDPKRNLNLAGRVADVVGTAATIAAGGWAVGAMAGGTGAGILATTKAGFGIIGSGIAAAAGKVGTGLAMTVLSGALSGKAGEQAAAGQGGMTPEQAAAWAQYGPGGVPGGMSYGGSGGGGGGGSSLLPDSGPMGPGTASPAGTSYLVPLALLGVAGLLYFTSRKKGGSHV